MTDVVRRCQTLPENIVFDGDLLTTHYHEQVLEAILTLSTFDIPSSWDGAFAMVYLQCFTWDGNKK